MTPVRIFSQLRQSDTHTTTVSLHHSYVDKMKYSVHTHTEKKKGLFFFLNRLLSLELILIPAVNLDRHKGASCLLL